MKMPKLSVSQVASICPDYSDIRELDAGGFKTVYHAKKGEREEVIKVIAIPSQNGDEQVEAIRDECIGRVAREVEILERCQSPYMVKVGALPFSHHTLHGQDFVLYSEEFLPGRDLWKILKNTTLRPDEAEAKLLMKCLLLCITEIWEMKVVHRDIKPSNVIKLNEPERPFVLLDLGIAFSVADTGLTYNADMRDPPSTFRYLAPEMADLNFRDHLDFRADLYTTALTVYEYSCGCHPIAEDQDDPIRTVARAIRQHPTPLASHRPEYSPQFTHLIDQLLKKKPALRPANLKRLIQMMEA